ncbi:MAG: response regulator [Blastocatellia bacterium]
MLINEGRVSSHNLSTIQQPVWTTWLRKSAATAFDEASDGDSAVKDFLHLAEAARAALSSGRSSAIGLLRVRALSRLSFEAAHTDTVAGHGDEHTAMRQRTVLNDLADFLASRLDTVFSPDCPGVPLRATAIYGAYTLMIWQPDCTDEELSARLQIWREEYRFLKHSDFVAGIAAAPEIATDLLSLIGAADDALTEAHAARRIVCYDSASASTVRTHASHQPTLLIVDDNRDQVEILDLIMRQHSYHTLRAYNGEQALEAVTRHSPDLLLLDIGLPELDGFHVLSRLRDLNGGRLDLPVIMITGSDAEESVLRGFELGARDYVIKPCDPHDLLSRIQNILSVSSRL